MSRHHQATWPRLSGIRHRVACPYCDTLHQADLVEEGEAASCRECGAVLYRNRPGSLSRSAAFALTALVFFFLMLLFPFITLEAQGNTVTVSVPGAVTRLWEEGGRFVSLCLAFFVIAIPFLELVLLLCLALPLLSGTAWPLSRLLLRLFLELQAWGMVEVFFLGAVVSLLKLTKLASIDLGIGFWAVGGLMISLAGAIGAIDRSELWDRLESACFPKIS
jgi:paraquat-inducible protein A